MAGHSGCSRAGVGVSSHRTGCSQPSRRRNCSYDVQMRLRKSAGRLLLRRAAHLSPRHALHGVCGSGRQLTAGQSAPRATCADDGARTRVFFTAQCPLPTGDNRFRPSARDSPSKILTPSVRNTVHRATERIGARPRWTRAEKESSCLPEPFRFLGISPREH